MFKRALVTLGLTLSLCGTAYASNINFVDGKDVTVGHVCERVESYNKMYDASKYLHLINKDVEIGDKLLPEFSIGPSGYYEMMYDLEDRNKSGKRVGNYYMTNSGLCYYVNEDGTFVKNGNKDGYIYDEHGVRLNTANLVFAKYKDRWYDGQDYIYFDSVDDGVTFVMYAQAIYGFDQVDYMVVEYLDDNRSRIKKDRFLQSLKHSEEECKAFDAEVQRLYEKSLELTHGVPMSSAIVRAVRDTVFMDYTIDENYVCSSMSECIADKRGVCYHFAKLFHNILRLHGIETEYIFVAANGTDDNHVVLQYINEVGNRGFVDNSSSYLSGYNYLNLYTLRSIGTNNDRK